jgi:tetratricopeptide (TPR) repeat protein
MTQTRPIVLKIVLILLPLFFLGLIEAVLHLIPGSEEDKFVDLGPFSLFSKVEIRGETHFKVTHPSGYSERNTVFPEKKPEGSLRVFCVGGSASASWPHPVSDTYSAYLQQALQKAYAPRPVQVINVSAHGFASYRVKAVYEEIAVLEPDAVIVYSGNNEFLETRSYDTSSLANFVETFQDKLEIVKLARKFTRKAVLSGTQLSGVADFFWKKVQRESLELRSDPVLFAKVKQHYHDSIESIVHHASRQEIPVLLLTVPVNLKDWLPNVSDDSLTGENLALWRVAYNNGRRQLLLKNADAATGALKKAAELNPNHSDTWFWLARAQEAAGDLASANRSYTLAKDLDLNPFRAHSDFNISIRNLAEEYAPKTNLVDLERIFASRTPTGTPGFDLFLDYVHPTQRGNELIAESVFRALVDEKVFPVPPRTTEFLFVPIEYANGRYDETLNLQLQYSVFRLCCMTHQYDSAILTAEHIRDLIANRPEDIQLMAEVPTAPTEDVLEAIRVLGALQDFNRRVYLEQPVSDAEARDVQQAVAGFYTKWYRYGRL